MTIIIQYFVCLHFVLQNFPNEWAGSESEFICYSYTCFKASIIYVIFLFKTRSDLEVL